jgi:hypothetical protein
MNKPDQVSPEELERRRLATLALDARCASLVDRLKQDTALPYALVMSDAAGFVVAIGGDTRLASLVRAGLTDYLRANGHELELTETPAGLIPEARRQDVGNPYPTGEPVGGG